MPTFNAKDRRAFQNLCHLTERGVLSIMRDLLYQKYDHDKVVATPSFVYAFGDIPVALVAHADTVFKIPPALDTFFYDQERDVIWSPDGLGADDRAGVFAIIQILRRYHLKPHVIITTGEESGCIGAGKLIAHMVTFKEDLKFMIQLDRRNRKDAVYYDCDNEEFEKFITPFGFKTEWGTFTDISVLAPVWGVAAVNFSVGYEDEHHEIERLHVDWLYETIGKVVQILRHVEAHPEMKPFEYVPAYGGYTYGSVFGRPYMYGDGLWDYYDEFDGDYKPSKTPPGFRHCDWCHKEVPEQNTIPVRFEHGTTDLDMCLSCHEKAAHQVVWCKQCGKAYYIPEINLKKVNVLDYLCEVCRDRKLNGSSETVQQRPIVLPGCERESTDRRDVQDVESKQGMVLGQRKCINL